jgi:hypothetical protein
MTFHGSGNGLEILDLFIVLAVQTGPVCEIVLGGGRFQGGGGFEDGGLEGALEVDLVADGEREEEVQFPGLYWLVIAEGEWERERTSSIRPSLPRAFSRAMRMYIVRRRGIRKDAMVRMA